MEARIYIIAGANGSGKSTISKVFLPAEGVVYVNPDDIAKELCPQKPEVCIARIAARVRRGGHYIPDADVRRRYTRSKKNFWNLYAPMVDYWTLLYNGDAQVVMTARKDNGHGTAIFSDSLFQLFKEGL